VNLQQRQGRKRKRPTAANGRAQESNEMTKDSTPESRKQRRARERAEKKAEQKAAREYINDRTQHLLRLAAIYVYEAQKLEPSGAFGAIALQDLDGLTMARVARIADFVDSLARDFPDLVRDFPMLPERIRIADRVRAMTGAPGIAVAVPPLGEIKLCVVGERGSELASQDIESLVAIAKGERPIGKGGDA
jgi:hypothetical protein